MKKLKLLAIATIVLFLGMARPLHAQSVNNFAVESFKADYYLSKDEHDVSQLKATEAIAVTFPEYNQNHGIERAIPTRYKSNNLNVKVETIQDETGNKRNFTTRTENDNLIVRIGDGDRYLHGKQVFILTYTQRDVMTFYPSHDEWFWNTTGTQWRQTFGRVDATIHIPNEIASQQNKTPRCLTGVEGSTATECTIQESNNGQETQVVVSSNRSLMTGETMSFVLGFEPGTFVKYRVSPWLIAALVLLFALPSLIVFGFMWRKWRVSGRDAKGRGVIVPQYEPPKDMTLPLAEVILKNTSTPQAFSATTLDLCIRGYLRLYEIDKKKLIGSTQQYELELITPPTDLSKEEGRVLKMLFGSAFNLNDRVNLSEKKNKLYTEAKSISQQVYKTVATEGYFANNPESARKTWQSVGITMLIVGMIGALLLLNVSIRKSVPYSIAPLGWVPAGFIMLIFAWLLPALTAKGAQTKEYLLGLKDYMQLAEADRIAMLQSPGGAEKTKVDPSDPKQLVKLYEKLLPYALLFGIETQWIKQFADMYGSAPDWYSGQSSFNTVALSHAISGLNDSSVASFSSPSSSSSSGFSGGGAGGGGGGGGGGGW